MTMRKKIPPIPGHAGNPVLPNLSGHSGPIVLKPFDVTQVCHEFQIDTRFHLIWKMILEMAFFNALHIDLKVAMESMVLMATSVGYLYGVPHCHPLWKNKDLFIQHSQFVIAAAVRTWQCKELGNQQPLVLTSYSLNEWFPTSVPKELRYQLMKDYVS